MGFGIDIGIDPERHAGRPVLTCRNFGKKGELRLGFDVEAKNVLFERESHFRWRLADPRKGDFIRGDACRQGAPEFASGDDVHSGAEPRQGFENGQIGIGFNGIANEMRKVSKCRIEYLVMAGQGRRRIAIKGCAYFRRECCEIDILGMHDAVLHREVMHGRIRARDRGQTVYARAAVFALLLPEPAPPRRRTWPYFAPPARRDSRALRNPQACRLAARSRGPRRAAVRAVPAVRRRRATGLSRQQTRWRGGLGRYVSRTRFSKLQKARHYR